MDSMLLHEFGILINVNFKNILWVVSAKQNGWRRLVNCLSFVKLCDQINGLRKSRLEINHIQPPLPEECQKQQPYTKCSIPF